MNAGPLEDSVVVVLIFIYGCSTFCVFENVYSQMVGRCKYIVEEVAKETKRRSGL